MSDQLELHPEGPNATPSQPESASPRQAAQSLAAPGGELSVPTSKAVAETFARVRRRRGVECEVVPHGSKWVVAG